MGEQHLPGEEVWLIGEHRSTGERKYYLSNLPADTLAQAPCRRDQGALGLRAGAPAAQGRTRPRPLRGPIMDRPAPARAHDHDRLRLPPVPPPQPGERGKKEPQAHRLSRACRLSGRPSSQPSPSHHQPDVPHCCKLLHLKICQSSARLRNPSARSGIAGGKGVQETLRGISGTSGRVFLKGFEQTSDLPPNAGRFALRLRLCEVADSRP